MSTAEQDPRLQVDAEGLAVWDAEPVRVIVEEAGGRFAGSVSSNGALELSGLRSSV